MLANTYETLLLGSPREQVLLITLNRPQAMNAINTRMGEELLAVFTALVADANYRCVVMTGAGDRAFSAGGDLKERKGMSDAQWAIQHELFERVNFAIIDCRLPIIAAVNGVAYGGGCELSLACDFIHAADTARFALTETSLGIMPGGGGTQYLPRTVGERRAKELIFSAMPFTAEQAARWGMVNEVVPASQLQQTVLQTAARIAANAPLAVMQAKKSIAHGLQMDRRTGILFEIEAYHRLVTTQDRHEGVTAFNEKRPPRFTGQ